MSEYALTILKPEEVACRWSEISELLGPALPHCNGEFELDDLLNLVAGGRAFVLALVNGGRIELASVCECIRYPRKTVLNVLVLGGRRLDVVARQFWDQVAGTARLLGASCVRGAVRPSMERYYRRIAPAATRAYAILERPV